MCGEKLKKSFDVMQNSHFFKKILKIFSFMAFVWHKKNDTAHWSHVLKLFYDNANPINVRVPFNIDQC